ncbi:MAG: monovalent cation/H+ antiporter complex subunit F [Egibacteraceae bacterium]
MSPFDTALAACLGVLGVAALLCLGRIVRPGSSVPDRVVALDAFLVVTVSGVAVEFLRSGESAFLDLLLVAAMVGFVGAVTVARYVERRGA